MAGVDFSPAALDWNQAHCMARSPLSLADIHQLPFPDRSFDLVLEQTFFCALDPSMRKDYASKMSEVVKGHLAGVLFKFPLTEKGPPFGGSEEEYRELFSPFFKIITMEECYNSIKPRKGNEIFFHLNNQD